MNIRIILVLSLLGVILGCKMEKTLLFKGDQNPLSKFGKDVQDAKPRGKVQEKPRPAVPRDLFRLTVTPKVLNFFEEQENIFQFKVEILQYQDGDGSSANLPKVNLELSNLPEGAVFNFDQNRGVGELAWTPKAHELGGRLVKNFRIKAHLSSLGEDAIGTSMDLNSWVHRFVDKPRIVSIGFMDDLLEGDYDYFSVIVEDLDSDSSTRNPEFPKLQVVPTRFNRTDGSRFSFTYSSAPKPVRNNVHHWKFEVRVDTNGREVTDGRERFYLGLMATSIFGVPSSVGTKSFTVNTRVKAPLTTLSRFLDAEALVRNVFSFKIYNMRPGGRVLLNQELNCTTLPGNPICECKRESDHQFKCFIEWMPAQELIGKRFTLRINTLTENRIGNQADVRGSFTHSFTITGEVPPTVPPETPVPLEALVSPGTSGLPETVLGDENHE